MKSRLVSAAFVVAAKELKDLGRDPRTLVLALGLPLILFPLLFWIVGDQTHNERAATGIYRIGVVAGTEIPMSAETDTRLEFAPIAGAPEDTVAGASPGGGGSTKAIRSGVADAILSRGSDGALRIEYDNSDRTSVAAAARIAGGTKTATEPTEKATGIELAPLYPPAQAAGTLFLSFVLPFMFFLFAATCPLAIAADLSSGEKERGSLEPLLSTCAPRSGIVLGKLIAVAAAGFLSVCAFFLGVYLSYLISPSIVGPDAMEFEIAPLQFILFFFFGLLVTAIFAAAEFAGGIFTRSVREAQLLGMPLLMVSMGAVYLAQSVDLHKVPALFPHIPLVNLALAIREIARGEPDPAMLIAAALWGSFYLAAAVIASRLMFGDESTILRS